MAGLRGDRAIRRKLFEYMRRRVLLARGNMVSFTLRKIKRALGVEEDRTAGAEIKAVLEALAKRGLLEVDRRGRAPRYAPFQFRPDEGGSRPPLTGRGGGAPAG